MAFDALQVKAVEGFNTTETGRLFFQRRAEQSPLARNVFELSPRGLQISPRDHIPSRSCENTLSLTICMKIIATRKLILVSRDHFTMIFSKRDVVKNFKLYHVAQQSDNQRERSTTDHENWEEARGKSSGCKN